MSEKKCKININEKYQKGLAQLKASAINDIINIIEDRVKIEDSTSYSRFKGYYDDSTEHCKYLEIKRVINKMDYNKQELRRKYQ